MKSESSNIFASNLFVQNGSYNYNDDSKAPSSADALSTRCFFEKRFTHGIRTISYTNSTCMIF